MANIGSAFLGDHARRIRHLSSSTHNSGSTGTPPSSPPPPGMIGRNSTSPLAQSFHDMDLDDGPSTSRSPSRPGTNNSNGSFGLSVDPRDLPPSAPRKPIDPQLALELRVRWLEALVLGLSGSTLKGKGKELGLGGGKGENLVRLAENVQGQLEAAVDGNEGLRKFMAQYDQHAHLLTSSFALSGVLQDEAPSYSDLSPEEIDAFLTEMEPDIRAADSDMREIDALVKKGVTSAGKLSDYETLQPRLDALLKANTADIELAASLERRIATLMQKHANSVDALSELFVAWDDAITGAEDSITQMEREKQERSRLGLE
ncbi:hypothetical protein D9611_014262 [Ephemerocybe angulata]|uniref:Uncharacterized protein n=1 Tax=Ephemerocybe angulata TaxID=980116 RepID=A0A8H5BSS7_9AGAR|nr:hypothetical protein D9611_014262 [Tulosesus angulatus]